MLHLEWPFWRNEHLALVVLHVVEVAEVGSRDLRCHSGSTLEVFVVVDKVIATLAK